MKTATSSIVAVAALVSLATTSIACSSPTDKEDVDTGSALAELRSPTGSFSAETAGKAFGGYRGQRADSSKVSAPSTAGGSGLKPGSSSTIKLLDSAAASGACSEGAACACPNGGTMSYTAESSADGHLAKVTFDACTFEDGYAFDGKAVLLVSNKSLLGLAAESSPAPAKAPAPSSPPSSSDDSFGSEGGLQEAEPAPTAGGQAAVSILLAAKGTVSQGKQSTPLEFALLTEAKYAFLAVKVADGTVVIGVSDDGHAIVKSKEGTWRCNTGSRGWVCKSDSGQSLDVSEETPSEGTTGATSGEGEGTTGAGEGASGQ